MVKRYTSPAIIFATADGPLVTYEDYDALAVENAELRRCLDGGFDCAGERMRLAAELAEVKADRQAIWTAASKREARREALESALETISNGEGAGGLAETERLQAIARVALAPLETSVYCAPCEDGECAVHPSTNDRAGKQGENR